MLSANAANTDNVFVQLLSAATWIGAAEGLFSIAPGTSLGPIDWNGPVSVYTTAGGSIHALRAYLDS